MDLSTDTLQSLAIGASGGVPLTLFLLNSMKSLRDSFDTFRDQLERVSTRLQKLELAFEMQYLSEIKTLQDRVGRLENGVPVKT